MQNKKYIVFDTYTDFLAFLRKQENQSYIIKGNKFEMAYYYGKFKKDK